MKAALLKQFGQPLFLEEIPDPVPGPGQVVVQVEACGVCHSDLHIARGEWEGFRLFMRLPVVPGHEVAGTVVRTGPGSDLREGDRVGVPWFHHTCGECFYCRRDQEVYCERPSITGVTVHGGFAEYLLAWCSHAIPLPEELSCREAAPLFCAGATVYSALRKVPLKSARLGIWGLGGLGHLGVQLGKLEGAHVTAVDPVPEKCRLAQTLGADEVVSVEEAKEWFSDPRRKVDVALVCAPVLEAFQSAFRSLRKEGVLLIVGLPGEPFPWSAGDLVRAGVRLIPSRVSSRRELRKLLQLAAAGRIRCAVEEHPLEEINRLLEDLAQGRGIRRAVVRCRPG